MIKSSASKETAVLASILIFGDGDPLSVTVGSYIYQACCMRCIGRTPSEL